MKKLYPSSRVLPGLLIKHYLLYNSTIFLTPKFYFMQKLFTLRIFMFLSLLGIVNSNLFAQTNVIANGGTYRQNFDTMAISPTATLPEGWRIGGASALRTSSTYASAGTQTTKIGGANVGSGNSDAGIYNFGAGTTTNGDGDRAVGGIPTNSNEAKTINVFLDLVNTGTTPITDLIVSYNVEKYRNGSNADSAGVWLYYSTDGIAWQSAGAVIAYGHDTNENGYSPAPDPALTKFLSASITIASRPPTSHIYLLWSISVGPAGTGNNADHAQGLAIDDIKVTTAAGGPIGGPYYRTVKSGLWSDPAIWENSSNPSFPYSWAPASIAPDFNAETITIMNRHTVTVATSVTTDQTIVDAGGILIINTGVTLSVNDGIGFDLTINGTLTNNGSLVVQSRNVSNNEGTASIGTSSGTIQGTGRETVERYVSTLNKSAWRLLTAPLRGFNAGASTNTSVWEAWQNSGSPVSNGTGTRVTGPAPDPNNGLDAVTPLASMQWWDAAAQTLRPVTNTKTTFLATSNVQAANSSFYIYIDGDRLASSFANQGTRLIPSGRLQLGDQIFGVRNVASAFSLVGNPYASSLDLNQFRLSNLAHNVNTSYWYWDPYLTGQYGAGAYVTVSYDADGNETIAPAAATHTRFLQSGQAMFVQTTANAAATVTFTESQKIDDQINNIMRVQTARIDGISVNLNVLRSGAPVLIDGIVAKFNDSYFAGIDRYDAAKLANGAENISFMRNGSSLSIERRPLSNNDVLYLNLQNLRGSSSYQLEIKPDFTAAGLTAYFIDNYLKTTTTLDLSKTTIVDFTINSDAASTGANRFSISFTKPGMTVSTGSTGISVFPNPVTNGVINLQMSNMPQGIYNVRVFNGMGQVVATKQINHAAGSSNEAIQLGRGISKGIYQLEVVKPDNSKFSTKVITN
jgi:Secretion system C-terminal sorting domain